MLVIDSNETLLVEYFSQTGLPFKKEQIRIDGERCGDLTNETRTFLIERKSKDFWNLSHTQEQLTRMYGQDGMRLFLIIQGTYTTWTNDYLEACKLAKLENRDPPSIEWAHSILMEGIMNQGLQVLFLPTLKEIADLCLVLDSWEAQHAEPAGRKTVRRENPFLTNLCSIRGIGPKLGAQLLARFDTPAGVYLASDEELLSVPGIGPAKLKSIHEHVG